MNWKNVWRLLQVERKSGRLIRGTKSRLYTENVVLALWPYWTAAILGIVGGLLADIAVSSFYATPDAKGFVPLNTAALSFYSVLPTLVLGISIVFTLFQQIQLAGKASAQVMYWLPVTWEEHTLASILTSLSGLPAAVVVGLSAGLLVFSVPNGLIVAALLAIILMLAAAFLASSITEIFRVLQVRFTGAMYKSSGKAAIWLRLASSLLVFIIFYAIYFYAVSGTSVFISNVTSIQNGAWWIPFFWPALILSLWAKGMLLEGSLFTALTAVLIAALYYAAVGLNKRFGLYEPPALTLQKAGVYAPKIGFLGKLGFSSVEAALIRKDFRALTRRRELTGIYITPIIIMIISIFYAFGFGSTSAVQITFWSVFIFLVPAGGLATLLGQVLIGEEGQVVWRIYASPISAKNLVKAKFFIIIVFSVVILIISSIVGILVFHPTVRKIVIAIIESLLISIAAGAVSLQIGLKGPDFSGTRRQQMVRREWALIGTAVSFLVGIAIFIPVLAQYGLAFIKGTSVSTTNYAIGVVISVIISFTITAVFYKIDIGNARDFLRKAEY